MLTGLRIVNFAVAQLAPASRRPTRQQTARCGIVLPRRGLFRKSRGRQFASERRETSHARLIAAYVRPGGRPDQIAVRVKGGERLKVTDAGELEIQTALGAVRFSRPVAYQEANVRQPVAVRYAVRGNEYGFELGEHDKSRRVIIDPFLSATFVGGSGAESVRALALDHAGNAFVAGATSSADFMGVTPGSADPRLVNSEAFVARFDASLTTPVGDVPRRKQPRGTVRPGRRQHRERLCHGGYRIR